MGILELVELRTFEAAKRVGEEMGIAICMKKMLAKNFSVETVADVFEVPTSNIKVLAQELEVEAYLKQGLTIAQACQALKASGQEILLSENQLADILEETQAK